MTKIQAQLNRLQLKYERLYRVEVQKWFELTNRRIRRDLTKKFIKAKIPEFTDWEWVEAEGSRILKPAVLKIYLSGKSAARRSVGIKTAFDVLDVNAVRAVDRVCSELVREVTRGTKRVINVHIRRGIREGLSMAKIVPRLKPLVGLTSGQAQSVVNFRAWLRNKYPLMPAREVNKKTALYRGRVHTRRMETIARTETARAQNTGYIEGLAGVGVKEVEFSAYPGCCGPCKEYDGRKYKVEDAPAIIPVHPSCRCIMLPVIADRTVRTPRTRPI